MTALRWVGANGRRQVCLPSRQPSALHAEPDKGPRASSGGTHEGVLATYDKSGSLVFMTLGKGYIAVLLANTFRFVDLIKANSQTHSQTHCTVTWLWDLFPECAHCWAWADLQVQGNLRAIGLSMSKRGDRLLVHYHDKIIRPFDILQRDLDKRKQFSLPDLRSHILNMQVRSESIPVKYRPKQKVNEVRGEGERVG